MKITIDTTDQSLAVTDAGQQSVLPLYSTAAFEVLSREWLRVGWNLGHWSSFSWMGFRLLQLPEDVLRLQEAICALRPDVIVETGTCMGGSTIFFASLCELLGRGRVVSVERTLQDGVRESLKAHPLGHRIKLYEGDSCSAEIFSSIEEDVSGAATVLVFLDSNHTKAHVANELALYSKLVTNGSYLIAADGVMKTLADTPKGDPSWREDNPAAAAREFAQQHPEFVPKGPSRLFTSEADNDQLTYFPDGWLKRCDPSKT